MSLPPPELAIDSAAVLWSASEADRAERPLLILMHGYGSDEADLFGLAPYLPLQPVIASIRAPIPEGPGFAWFSRYTNLLEDPSPINADAATRAVLDWLDEQPPAPSVALLGFSQGGSMALQLMRHRPQSFSYAVILSGAIISGEQSGDAELAQRRPPVFWGRGSQDSTVAPGAVDKTADWLAAHTSLEARVYEGMAHSISPSELADVSAFIRARP